jgi:hypothetical protein
MLCFRGGRGGGAVGLRAGEADEDDEAAVVRLPVSLAPVAAPPASGQQGRFLVDIPRAWLCLCVCGVERCAV